MIWIILCICLFTLTVLLLWNRCTFGGPAHRFEPRYSEEVVPPSPEKMPTLNGTHAGVVDMVYALSVRKQTYIHDVCVWCGKTTGEKS